VYFQKIIIASKIFSGKRFADLRPVLLVFVCFCNFAYGQSPDSVVHYVTINNITITGNKVTRDKIITRELVKKKGDTVHVDLLDYFAIRSQQNIFNTQLFIYDSVKYVMDTVSRTADITIKVKERWYIIPSLILEIQDRNFNSWWLTKDPFRTNYGVALDWNNVTGSRDNFTFIFRRGYSEKYGASYRIPYINKAQTIGLNFSYSYSRNNEVAFRTDSNALMFHRDYHKYMRFEHEGKVGISHRPDLYQRNVFELLYVETTVNDTIPQLNFDFLGAGKKRIDYLSLQYRYSFDKRDNKPYPLIGWAVDFTAVKDGFRFKDDATIDNMSVVLSVKRHQPIWWRIFVATQIKGRYMNTEKLPYYFNRALGYSDFIRGYEYYVIDGQNYLLMKNSIKLQIVKTRVFEMKFLKRFPQFSTVPFAMYFNLNADRGYVQDKFYGKNNSLSNSWQFGYGAGLDIVTYYDIVLRFEYSINKLGQSGLFIHMNAGI
jgi:outer membrane protein assembly factor BamA